MVNISRRVKEGVPRTDALVSGKTPSLFAVWAKTLPCWSMSNRIWDQMRIHLKTLRRNKIPPIFLRNLIHPINAVYTAGVLQKFIHFFVDRSPTMQSKTINISVTYWSLSGEECWLKRSNTNLASQAPSIESWLMLAERIIVTASSTISIFKWT